MKRNKFRFYVFLPINNMLKMRNTPTMADEIYNAIYSPWYQPTCE